MVSKRFIGGGVVRRHVVATPPRDLADRYSGARFSLLRAYNLRAVLKGEALELTDLAYPELRTELEKQASQHSRQEVREFRRDMGALLPWYRLWAAVSCGDVAKAALQEQLASTRGGSKKDAGSHYLVDQDRHVVGEIARVWFDALNLTDATDAESINTFAVWINNLNRPLFTPTLHALARLAARWVATRQLALELAEQAFRLARDERADAEVKSEGFVDVARAVLPINRNEAKAYFDEAIAVASKVGDENAPRWEAMLDLAHRAARPTRPAPEIAYRFSRCAELTWHYADDHFEWQSTVEALSLLCPSSAFAILSRWRDRRVGWTGDLLPATTEVLTERGCLDPRDALPLVSFESRWDYAQLLDTALGKSVLPAEKTALERLLFSYARCAVAGASTWKRLRDTVACQGLPVHHLDECVSSAERQERGASQPQVSGGEERYRVADRQWDDIFGEGNLTTADGVAAAFAAYKETPSPWEHKQFFGEAIRRVAPGMEVDFVTAVGDTPTFNLYSFSDFLDQVPEGWLARTPLRLNLERAVKTVCRRYCMKVKKHRYYESPPFDAALKRTGVRDEEVIDVVLDAIGESPEAADSTRLFSLVGLVTSKLSSDQALDVLAFGLDLFEPVLELDDGDGPWHDDLAPPETIEESLAGYIYAGLAAPSAAVRWEAAHAVVGMCALDRKEVLGHLLDLANNDTGGPFTDARLPFYRLHAFQWLLIACSRAATEHPAPLAPFASRFVNWALGDQPHVMIRQFAARTALTLHRQGLLPLKDGDEYRLERVNVTPLTVVASNSSERVSGEERAIVANDDKDRFYFYLDIGPYWFEPLGSVFGTVAKPYRDGSVASHS